MKYGLPIPNIDPKIEGMPDFLNPEANIRETINIRIFEKLKLNENTSY